MGRAPCCEEGSDVKKGPWTAEEDEKLLDYINKNGHGSWRTLAKRAGLNRCGKSCRLRWTNYLRPDIKRGKFTLQEETLIINLHSLLGNKWSKIASHLPGRTDNEIKNLWNTQIRKKLLQMGIDPETHKPRTDFNHLINLSQLLLAGIMPNSANTNPPVVGLQGGHVAQLAKLQLLQNLLLQIMSSNNSPSSSSFVNNPYLLGNPSLNDPLSNTNAYLLNGSSTNSSSTLQTLVLQNEDYANPAPPAAAIFSQSGQSDPSHEHDHGVSWTHVEGGLPNNPQQDLDYSKISSIILHEDYQAAGTNNPLPALVASFPAGTETFNHMDQNNSCCNTSAPTSIHDSPNYSNSTAFDDWAKFLEDETSGSYWKEILDLASTSASPNSW